MKHSILFCKSSFKKHTFIISPTLAWIKGADDKNYKNLQVSLGKAIFKNVTGKSVV